MKIKKIITIILTVIFSAFLLSGAGIYEPYLNINGYHIEMYKTNYSDDGYFFVINNSNAIIEAKKFERCFFVNFYLKDDVKKNYGVDSYREMLEDSTQINYLDLIHHDGHFDFGVDTCTFGLNIEKSDNPCENESQKKLISEYESFLNELGISEESLLNMLKYKLKHPANNLLWNKFATDLKG